ncbi:hypothetical protein EIN_096770 [Entamoeba invadens IP1]|uniref:CN hydrolase domain-containing protein n=1 Tax=Entamoeba invadens IP1 TaxID=370355 RepID=A0A0A1U0J7_ENTIV|nr:hypothetical protein EIN_096770 [Entamoeba invadens IP1]ELP87410.1 hypothetical protein EIN_096770 [Entamoeba invadens IP1]|eukprot:XP_004254181.1 hypothetical protein EIN_096770 [Entamoeba invadens IP1]
MSIKITLIQTDVYPTLSQTFSEIERLVDSHPSDLYLLTECFTTGFSSNLYTIAHPKGGYEIIKKLQDISKKYDCSFIGGIICEDEGIYYNRVIVVDKNGLLSKYDKVHLYHFGCENQLVRGNLRVVVTYKGVRIFLAICYDIQYPAFIRRTDANDYDIIVCPINYGSKIFHTIKALAATRAIENGVWVFCTSRIGVDKLGIEFSGHSFVVNELGQIVGEAGEKSEALTLVFDKSRLQKTKKKLGLGEKFVFDNNTWFKS